MLDRKEIWKELLSKIKADTGDIDDMPEVSHEFVLQSAILEVLLDNRDLLVNIKDGLIDVESEVANVRGALRTRPLFGPG